MSSFQRAFVQRLSQLGIAYRGSSIVEGAGQRYFDESLRGGAGIGSRFLLLLDDTADQSIKEATKQLAESYSHVVEFRLARRRGVALLRPDGYLACDSPSQDIDSALATVRSIIARQIS